MKGIEFLTEKIAKKLLPVEQEEFTRTRIDVSLNTFGSLIRRNILEPTPTNKFRLTVKGRILARTYGHAPENYSISNEDAQTLNPYRHSIPGDIFFDLYDSQKYGFRTGCHKVARKKRAL